MRQELLDLALGELPDQEAGALRARIEADPELAREYAELSSVLAVMSRGERIEPAPEGHDRLLAEARRLSKPSLWQQLGSLGELVRFRFRYSLGFRIAMVSLAIHFVALSLLYHYKFTRLATDTAPDVNVVADVRPVEPAPTFRASLAYRKLSHGPRLARYGIEGQQDLIESTLIALQATQADDGSFGSIGETGKAALAFLAEGEASVSTTARGQALRRTMRFLRREVRNGGVDGFAHSALIEDYTLSYDHFSFEERVEYYHGLDAGYAGRTPLPVPAGVS